MAFADVYARWSKLLIWGSLAALFMGVLNSIRMSFAPTTLWQLGVYVAMIGIGGGLMFKGLKGSGDNPSSSQSRGQPEEQFTSEIMKGLDDLKRQINQMKNE